MKRFKYTFIAFVTLLIALTAVIQAQTLVDDWGRTTFQTAAGWPILNTSTTPAGDASIGSATPHPSGWATVRGMFDAITPTTTQAIVVSGKLEFVGGGGDNTYGPLRYALTYDAGPDTLQYQYTDSALWTSSTGNNFGYEFTPRTGTGIMANGVGGTGTIWRINNGNWPSTNSNNGPALAMINQAPRNTEMVEGVYDWAISIQPLGDGRNEVRWYLVEENNQYSYGGIVIDTSFADSYNAISFGLGDDLEETGQTQFNLTGVQVGLGDPIEIPVAPFEGYYLDQWGRTTFQTAAGWPILNDSTYLVGDASIGSATPHPSGWATLRAGFGMDIEPTTDKAIILTGKLEFVGGGGDNAYGPLRYALTYDVGPDTLKYRLTDSALWTGSTGNNYGYEFTPRTGTGIMANGVGGTGTIWRVNNGNWPSTNSNNGPALAMINQAPRNAEMVEGMYDWAISIQPLGDGRNEVRWYLVEENNQYWYGGTVIDTSFTDSYNAISFGLGDDLEETGQTRFNLFEVKVDLGDPIEIPVAPFEGYYLDQWGRTTFQTATGWPILNDSTFLVGDASIGSETPHSGWATLRAGFGMDIEPTTDKAIILTGKLEFVGGGGDNAYGPLRYALTYDVGPDTLQYRLTDSALWTGSTGNNYGYEFTPRTGTGIMANGVGGTGTIWRVNNGNWPSTNSNNGPALAMVEQAPRNAEMVEGMYDWAISIQPLGDGTNEVRWYLLEENKQYFYGGTVIDTSTTNSYNAISFGLGDDLEETGQTQFNLFEVYVDLGDPIDIPKIFEIVIDGEKDEFYNNLEDPDDGYLQLQWFHGNDNGFAVDNNDLSAKVWTAWDEEWFYMYSEVTDDTVSATSANAYQNDVLELKIDPQPTDSTQAGGSIFAPNLTILGTMGNDTLNTIADTSKQFVRKVVSNGYVLELAIKWAAITTGGEIITPDVGNVFGMGINFHDNDGSTTTPRQATIQWAAVMLDHVWDTPKYLGRVYFLSDNKLEWDPTNNMTGVENELLYDGSPVGVSSESGTIPTEFALSQNYPNPFNPTTTIQFALPQNSDVKVVVVNMLGQVVEELVNGNLDAGYHNIRFNASNLSSGVYFYKIEAGDFVSVKKLMLLK